MFSKAFLCLSYFFAFLTYISIFENPEDKALDEQLSKRIDQFQWLLPSHLDIEPGQCNTELWQAAKTGFN